DRYLTWPLSSPALRGYLPGPCGPIELSILFERWKASAPCCTTAGGKARQGSRGRSHMIRMHADARLAEIRDKVEAGERLSFDDGLFLSDEADLFTLGELANRVRERKN